jgi:hypothetical protein
MEWNPTDETLRAPRESDSRLSIRERVPCKWDIGNKSQKLMDFQLIHNYGHGTNGFTLSWGCALDVVNLIAGVIGSAEGGSKNTSRESTSQLSQTIAAHDEK